MALPVPITLSPKHFTTFRRRLLRWFRLNQRDLPWRNSRDPYAIWVSEIMLQQTQVATVVPAFKRFLRQFPNVFQLARAAEQDVLRAWQGLGYYRRARCLHQTAQQIVAQHDGNIPADPKLLRSYPGFGRYTVGAVLSQAYDMRLPILEANSQRVLCRLIGFGDDPKTTHGQKLLWDWAEKLLPTRHAGDFNQALMELGALQCTANNPQCETCPVREFCRAKRTNRQHEIPVRSGIATICDRNDVAVVICKGKRVLLVQRPTDGRWAGLWEFPRGAVTDGEKLDDAVLRCVKQLTNYTVTIGNELKKIRHSVMNERIRLSGWIAHYSQGTYQSDFYQHGKWLAPCDLEKYPQSSPQRRLSQIVALEPLVGKR